jgi:Flp pilus assembly protein TadD
VAESEIKSWSLILKLIGEQPYLILPFALLIIFLAYKWSVKQGRGAELIYSLLREKLNREHFYNLTNKVLNVFIIFMVLLFAWSAYALSAGYSNQRKMFEQNVADGYRHLGNGSYAVALREFFELTERYPKIAVAWNGQGAAHFKLGEYYAAALAFRRAMRLSPDLEAPKFNLGYVLTLIGSPDESIRIIKELVKEYPENIQNYQNLGSAYLANGQFEDATRTFDLVVRRNGEKKEESLFGKSIALACLASRAKSEEERIKFAKEATAGLVKLISDGDNKWPHIITGLKNRDNEEVYSGQQNLLLSECSQPEVQAVVSSLRPAKSFKNNPS